jgi:ABC-2 type transport system ATP-binding protein
MDNAEKMCDSVCIIARGEKVLDGRVTDVKQAASARHVALSLVGGVQNGVNEVLRDASLVRTLDDNANFIELELAPTADSQVLLRRLLEAGAKIDRFEMMQPSLHQIFLQRVGAQGIETGMSGHG